MIHKFHIPGPPPNAWGKNSKTARVNSKTGKAYVQSNPATLQTNEMLVDAFESQFDGDPISGAVRVQVFVHWPWRKADLGKHIGAIRKTTKPDGDNVLASIFDSLEKAGVLVNDSQIADFYFSKWWGSEPGIWVEVQEL